jgi:hypothetical protein
MAGALKLILEEVNNGNFEKALGVFRWSVPHVDTVGGMPAENLEVVSATSSSALTRN